MLDYKDIIKEVYRCYIEVILEIDIFGYFCVVIKVMEVRFLKYEKENIIVVKEYWLVESGDLSKYLFV